MDGESSKYFRNLGGDLAIKLGDRGDFCTSLRASSAHTSALRGTVVCVLGAGGRPHADAETTVPPQLRFTAQLRWKHALG